MWVEGAPLLRVEGPALPHKNPYLGVFGNTLHGFCTGARQMQRFRPPNSPQKPAPNAKTPRNPFRSGAFCVGFSALALRRVRSSARRAAALHSCPVRQSSAALSILGFASAKAGQTVSSRTSYHAVALYQAMVDVDLSHGNSPLLMFAPPRPACLEAPIQPHSAKAKSPAPESGVRGFQGQLLGCFVSTRSADLVFVFRGIRRCLALWLKRSESVRHPPCQPVFSSTKARRAILDLACLELLRWFSCATSISAIGLCKAGCKPALSFPTRPFAAIGSGMFRQDQDPRRLGPR